MARNIGSEETFWTEVLSSLRDFNKLKKLLKSNDLSKIRKEINSIQDEEGNYILGSAIEKNVGKGSDDTIGEASDSNQKIGVSDTKAIVNILMQYGANINAVDKIGYPPLFRAIYYGCEEVAILLIQAKADVNVVGEGEGSTLETPIQMAVRLDRKKVVDCLVKAGANVNAGVGGQTALHLAISKPQ